MASKKYTADDRVTVSAAVLADMVGGLSLRKSCEKNGVARPTFLLWCNDDPVLADQYARARQMLIEDMEHDLLEIADAPVGATDNGSTDSGAVAKQRLQVDTRKWLLSKLAPKKFGDKLETTLLGNGPGGAIVVNASINGVAVGNKPRP